MPSRWATRYTVHARRSRAEEGGVAAVIAPARVPALRAAKAPRGVALHGAAGTHAAASAGVTHSLARACGTQVWEQYAALGATKVATKYAAPKQCIKSARYVR